MNQPSYTTGQTLYLHGNPKMPVTIIQILPNEGCKCIVHLHNEQGESYEEIGYFALSDLNYIDLKKSHDL